jgi:hypothetical protein
MIQQKKLVNINLKYNGYHPVIIKKHCNKDIKIIIEICFVKKDKVLLPA